MQKPKLLKSKRQIIIVLIAFILSISIMGLCRSCSKKENTKTVAASEKSTVTTEKEENPKSDETMLFFTDYSKSINGFYTGKYSKTDNCVELNYKDSTVLIEENDVVPIPDGKVLASGVISQLGKSACGAACLYMLANNAKVMDNMFTTYDSLLTYAEQNGYNNQGSLYSDSGGMDCNVLMKLASDAYSMNLVNKYSENEAPSVTVKNIIDSGKQAIVLVKRNGGDLIAEYVGFPHFVLVTGYQETEKETLFFYADSYYFDDITEPASLKYVSAPLFNDTVSAKFDEPNAILCIE